MSLLRKLNRAALALVGLGSVSTGAVTAMAAATEIVSGGVTAVAEERTHLDHVIKLQRLGLDPEGLGIRQRPLSGLEIAAIRIAAGRSQLPTKKRYLNWKRQPNGSHVGDKQALRNARRDTN